MEALKFYTISIISNRHTDIIISTISLVNKLTKDRCYVILNFVSYYINIIRC